MAYSTICLSNTNIHTFRRVLEEAYDGAKCPPVMQIGAGETKTTLKGLILYPTVQDFIRHLDVANTSRCINVVFGPAVVLEYLEPVVWLDLYSKPNSYTYRFKPIDPRDLRDTIDNAVHEKIHNNVTSKSIDVIPNLLSDQPSSLMAPILNYLYSMPNTNDRLRVQTIVYAWLCSNNTDIPELKEQLLAHKKRKAESVPLNALLSYLGSTEGQSYKKALQEVTKQKEANGTYNTAKIAKTFGVSEYDITYTMKAINKIRRTTNILVSEPLSKQFWDRRADPNKRRTKDKESMVKSCISDHLSSEGTIPDVDYISQTTGLSEDIVNTIYNKLGY